MTSSLLRAGLVAMGGLFTAAGIGAADGTAATAKETIAVLGTGDMGDSFGPRLAALGYRVVYGTRRPESERVRSLVEATGNGATAAAYPAAAEVADIVLLALPWQPMEQIVAGLGDMAGKIVIDMTWPENIIDDDGYDRIVVETSGAEQIQAWLPEAMVVKAFGTTGSNVIDDPSVAGGPVSIPIASDHRHAKEVTARIAAELGLDPVDAGPLRMARNIEAMMELYMVPFYQGRDTSWEFYIRRTNHWHCQPYTGGEIGDDRPPVVDAGNLAEFPQTQPPPPPCPE